MRSAVGFGELLLDVQTGDMCPTFRRVLENDQLVAVLAAFHVGTVRMRSLEMDGVEGALRGTDTAADAGDRVDDGGAAAQALTILVKEHVVDFGIAVIDAFD